MQYENKLSEIGKKDICLRSMFTFEYIYWKRSNKQYLQAYKHIIKYLHATTINDLLYKLVSTTMSLTAMWFQSQKMAVIS